MYMCVMDVMERSCICVLWILFQFASVSRIFQFGFSVIIQNLINLPFCCQDGIA